MGNLLVWIIEPNSINSLHFPLQFEDSLPVSSVLKVIWKSWGSLLPLTPFPYPLPQSTIPLPPELGIKLRAVGLSPQALPRAPFTLSPKYPNCIQCKKLNEAGTHVQNTTILGTGQMFEGTVCLRPTVRFAFLSTYHAEWLAGKWRDHEGISPHVWQHTRKPVAMTLTFIVVRQASIMLRYFVSKNLRMFT